MLLNVDVGKSLAELFIAPGTADGLEEERIIEAGRRWKDLLLYLTVTNMGRNLSYFRDH